MCEMRDAWVMTDGSAEVMTFMFSDIEGSTRLWEVHGSSMEDVLVAHDEIAQTVVSEAGGAVFKHTGDGFAASFTSAAAAIEASVSMQRALATTEWTPVERLRSRIGVHSGVAQQRDGDFFGRTVNRCARLMSVAHGGQIVVSGATQSLVGGPEHRSWGLAALGLHHLKDLSQPEQIYQVMASGLEDSFPKLGTVDAHPRSLPRVRGPLIGRHRLIETLKRRLDSDRLCTLVGPGGVGKTRAAIDTAEHVVAAFPDGAWFCRLRDLETADAMASAIAEVMRIDIADPALATPTLLSSLGDRAALLVLDGCEAAPDAVCDLIEELLDNCPTVRVVATSRERLRLRVGQVVVDPLDVPPPTVVEPDEIGVWPAVELFMERARGSAPDFVLTPENAGTIADICRDLDGLPLAVELAAAQIATLDPTDVLNRLERHVALAPRDGPSIGAVVSWSYDTLSDSHKRLFARLAVFDGGFDLAAVEAVCADDTVALSEVGSMLTDLVDKSLLRTSRESGAVRFSMLGLLRQFAAERLSEFEPSGKTHVAHFDHYLEFARRAAVGLAGSDEVKWVAAVGTEFANIRAASRVACREGRFHDAAALVWATYPYAFGRTRYEIVEWAAAVVAGLGDDLGELGPELVTIVGWGHGVRGDVAASSTYARRAVELARAQGRDRYLPHRLLIVGAILRGDGEAAAAEVQEARACLGGTSDPRAAIDLLGFEAFTMAISGRRQEALACIDEALSNARAVGNPSQIAWCLYEAGVIEAGHDNAAAAVALDQALELAELVENRYMAGIILMIRTRVAAESDDYVGSLTGFSEMLGHWYRLANWANLGNAIRLFASFLASCGHDESAAIVLGGLRGISERSPESLQVREEDDALSSLQERLSHRALETHTTRGAAFDMRALVEYCQGEIGRLRADLDDQTVMSAR